MLALSVALYEMTNPNLGFRVQSHLSCKFWDSNFFLTHTINIHRRKKGDA